MSKESWEAKNAIAAERYERQQAAKEILEFLVSGGLIGAVLFGALSYIGLSPLFAGTIATCGGIYGGGMLVAFFG